MRIHLYIGNHAHAATIGDTILMLQRGLEDCGLQACIAHSLVPNAWNVILEHFVEDQHMTDVRRAKAMGARLILIGTEPIIRGGFNTGVVADHAHYSRRDYWQLRFDNFVKVARMADAVWVLAESMVPGYTETLGRPARFLPHAYVNGFCPVQQRPEAERDIDFYFSGSMTAHRDRILGALARAGHRVMFGDHTAPEFLRHDLVSRAKVCLSLRLSPNNGIPSVSRMHFHLQNRSFVLHEAYDETSLLDRYVMRVPAAELIDYAQAALELPNRREIANAAHARFRAELPMAERLAPLVREAMGSVLSAAETVAA